MGRMAGGALQLVTAVQLERLRQNARRTYLKIFCGQGRGIDETDGVIIGQIGSKVCCSRVDVKGAAAFSPHTASEGDSAVMAAKAQLACAGGLANLGIKRGALVNLIYDGRELLIPRRGVGQSSVGSVTKIAEVSSLDRRQVVRRTLNTGSCDRSNRADDCNYSCYSA
jgi:hypothetical protein